MILDTHKFSFRFIEGVLKLSISKTTSFGIFGVNFETIIEIIIFKTAPNIPNEVVLLIDNLRTPSVNRKENL